MILFAAIYLALIATSRKEPTVVQFSQFVTAWLASLATREDEGQGLAEYGLILALVAVVCIAAVTALGTQITGVLGKVKF